MKGMRGPGRAPDEKPKSVKSSMADLFKYLKPWYKAIVAALLKDGRARVTGLYSEKSGKTYDATVVLEDDGKYANFKLAFDRQKGGKR